ncbi:hypothetical protein CDL12_19635 [Handroanthus impetiginosus]|uniref:Uncharacterized protein n=1 Tax=Handroanthus impetiginosus TaxID=429701 RepID=A0A2G9GR90_9LAMI|nr:hypothetical protein CDL12_19635 [Handroanthus impetiginosus]
MLSLWIHPLVASNMEIFIKSCTETISFCSHKSSSQCWCFLQSYSLV